MARTKSAVTEVFHNHFSRLQTPRVFRAPGRVNLIGEHTDYNLGFVMPIAIHLECQVAVGPSRDGLFRVFSHNENEMKQWPAHQLSGLQPAGHWSDYVIGVAQQLIRRGYAIPPQNLAIYSTVPVGSGLSSSAAIEVSTAFALLAGRSIDHKEVALLSQRAEIDFVGVPCGIMDQYVAVFGEADKAIRIDCRSVTHEAVPLPESVSIVVVNSMVKHELGSSAYRDRVRECAEAVAAVRTHFPEKESLRDVTPDELEQVRTSMSELVYRRARHVVTEDERVIAFDEASLRQDLKRMGELFVASHRSLQHDYEVSAVELDFLVDAAIAMPGVYGARMTGGGFGGCTVNLVTPGQEDAFQEAIANAYEQKFQRKPTTIVCIPDEGASELE